MKKLSCIALRSNGGERVTCMVFELNEGETIQDLVEKINLIGVGSCIPEVDEANASSNNWRERLEEILISLGEDISCMGYNTVFLLMEAIDKNPDYKNHFTMKELYAYATEKTGKPYIQLERNIRAMLERIFKCNDYDFIKKTLGIKDNPKKVTNAKFVALLVAKLFGKKS